MNFPSTLREPPTWLGKKIFAISGFCLFIFTTQSLSAASHRLSSDEVRLFKIVSKEKLQSRKSIALDPILCKAARNRAADMAKRDYFGHVDPSGNGPNKKVIQAGYVLPSFYDSAKSANSIESIAQSTGDPDSILVLWKNSPQHRAHILAEQPFFQEQISAGVGIFRSKIAPYFIYYVFLSAPKNLSTTPPALDLLLPNGKLIATTRSQSVVTLSSSPLMQLVLNNQ